MNGNTEKTLNWLSLFLLVGMFIGMTIVAILIFYPFKVISFDYYTLPVLNENSEVIAGEDLFYHISYCKYKDVPAMVIKTLHNGLVFTLEDKKTDAPIGCFVDRVGHVTIPVDTPPGEYYMRFAAQYHINSFQDQHYHTNTDAFRVIAAE